LSNTSKSPERNSGTGAVDAAPQKPNAATGANQGLLLELAGDAVSNRWIVRYCQDNPTFLVRVARALDPEGVKKLGKHINGYRLIVALLESDYGGPILAEKLNMLIADQTLIGFAKATYGCRVIQAAVEYLDPTAFNAVDALSLNQADKAVAVIEDQNGNHVMQKIIAKQKYDLNTFVNAVLPVTQKIAMNVFGCRVIMRLLEFGTIQQILSVGASLLTANMIGTLCLNEFGNFVMQDLIKILTKDLLQPRNLSNGAPNAKNQYVLELRQQILHYIEVNVVHLSCTKHGSTVVECAIKELSNSAKHDEDEAKQFMRIFDSIVLKGSNVNQGQNNEYYRTWNPYNAHNENVLFQLMKDRFGNFILSTLLDICEGEQLRILIAKLERSKDQLKKFKYGRFIVANLERKQRKLRKAAKKLSETGDANATWQ